MDGVLGGRGHQLHLHERHGRPHHRGDLRHRHLHDHGHRRAPNGAISPSASVGGRLRRRPGVHDHAGRVLPRRGRAGGRGLGGRGDQLHVHERAGQPHHRGQLRDRHATPSRPARAPAARSARPARSRSTTAPTRRSRSRRTCCYHIADVLVDGCSVGAVASYTFTNVQATTPSRPASRSTPTRSRPGGPERRDQPDGAVAVNCGADQAFTITPDARYHVADVLVDGSRWAR